MRIIEINNELNLIKPKSGYELIRLGNNNDGGYVVSDAAIKASSYLISGGYGNDFSFERDALKYNSQLMSAFLFDHSINYKILIKNLFRNSLKSFVSYIYQTLRQRRGIEPFPELRNILIFIKLSVEKRIKYINSKLVIGNIGGIELSKFVLESRITGIFIKLDIEESEYEVLEDCFRFKDIINGMVVEFHEIKKNSTKFFKIVNLLLNDFDICHVHINNFRPEVNDGWPNTIEMSFAKKKFRLRETSFEINNFYYSSLDQPNNRHDEEMALLFS